MEKGKWSGVQRKPEPPCSLNGGIPAYTHVLSQGHVLGQKVGEGVLEREGFLPVSNWKTLVSKSGQDGRNSVNRAPERPLDLSPRNRGKIDSVYVAGIFEWMQDVCVGLYQHFFSLSQAFPS